MFWTVKNLLCLVNICKCFDLVSFSKTRSAIPKAAPTEIYFNRVFLKPSEDRVSPASVCQEVIFQSYLTHPAIL